MSKKDKHVQRNPVFKGMMAGGNCKHQVIPNKKKEVENYWETEDYINSSPLTHEQKKYLSKSYVGETRIIESVEPGILSEIFKEVKKDDQ